MEKKDILCPDCGEVIITKERLENYGKCMACWRRELNAKLNKVQYIKFIDLSEDEKRKITHIRETKRKSAKKMRINKREKRLADKLSESSNNGGITKKVITHNNSKIYTKEVIAYIRSIANDDTTINQLLEKLQDKYSDINFTRQNLNSFVTRYSIPHSSKRGRPPKNISSSMEILTENISNIENNNDILDIEESYDSENSEIDLLLDNTIKVEEFGDVLEGDTSNDILQDISEDDTADYIINVDTDDIGDNIIDIEDTEYLEDDDISVEKSENIKKEKYNAYEEIKSERFIPIKAEIDNLLEKQFRRLNCALDNDYQTQDYIEMLEMLVYIIENGQNIISSRRKQQNIMNAYQSDMIHEMENTIAEPNNTNLSDKMFIIRNYRRHFENDYRDIAALRRLRESIDVEVVKEALTSLKKNLHFEVNPVYRPLVDTTLITKYGWAQPVNADSNKAKISITQYNPNNFQKDRNVTRIGVTQKTPPTDQLNAKTRKLLKRFRVSCKLSGGGYGVFSPWYRDYECRNSQIALDYATNTLKQISEHKSGVVYSDLSVVELNTDTKKEN